MKKWSKFLEENKEIVLQEFNKKDEAEVLKGGDRFSVSFEIELEAEGGEFDEDAYYEAENRARGEAAENYFGDVEEYFRESIRDLDIDSLPISMEVPTEAAEVWEWYQNWVAEVSDNDLDLIKASVAMDNDQKLEDSLLRGIFSILSDDDDRKEFIKDLVNNAWSRAEMQEELGWSDKQLTFDFEAGGGKHLYDPMGHIGKDKEAIWKLLRRFVINVDDLNGQNLFPTAKHPKAIIPIRSFINKYVGSMSDYDEAADDYIMQRYENWGPYTSISDVFDETFVYQIQNWEERISNKFFGMVESGFDEMVADSVNDFEEDPVEYLEGMGVEESTYFDEEDFRYRYEDNYGSGADCDVDALEEAMGSYFPNFMDKYENNLKFEEDGSLKCGIEFSMDNPPYMVGLETAIEYLEDFFDEYDDQSYFTFTTSTGLHTNVGYLNEEGSPVENYNLFKGLTFLNHRYATKGVGFPKREFSKWAGDLKEPAMKNIQSFLERLPEEEQQEGRPLTKKGFMKLYLSRNFDELSDILSSRVLDAALTKGSKSIGFNVNYTKRRNYVEFRYPGNLDPTLESMTKALLYYAFIIKTMADPDYKKKEYLKDLVGFINNLQGEKVSVAKMDFHKRVKKGDVMMKVNYNGSMWKTFQACMEESITLSKTVETESSEYDRVRMIANKAYTIVSDCIYALGSNIRWFVSEGQPAIYVGIKGSKVIIEEMFYDPAAPLKYRIDTKDAPSKAFQSDLDSTVYRVIRSQETEPIRKLYDIIISSKTPLEVSQKLVQYAIDTDSAQGEAMALRGLGDQFEWKKKEKKDSSDLSDKKIEQAREAGTVDGQLNDMVDDLISGRLEELKSHFNRWDF